MSKFAPWWMFGLVVLSGAFSLGSDCDVTVEGFDDGFFVEVDDDDDWEWEDVFDFDD